MDEFPGDEVDTTFKSTRLVFAGLGECGAIALEREVASSGLQKQWRSKMVTLRPG